MESPSITVAETSLNEKPFTSVSTMTYFSLLHKQIFQKYFNDQSWITWHVWQTSPCACAVAIEILMYSDIMQRINMNLSFFCYSQSYCPSRAVLENQSTPSDSTVQQHSGIKVFNRRQVLVACVTRIALKIVIIKKTTTAFVVLRVVCLQAQTPVWHTMLCS